MPRLTPDLLGDCGLTFSGRQTAAARCSVKPRLAAELQGDLETRQGGSGECPK